MSRGKRVFDSINQIIVARLLPELQQESLDHILFIVSFRFLSSIKKSSDISFFLYIFSKELAGHESGKCIDILGLCVYK